MVECTLSITHCLRLNLQLHTINSVRTCRISSFCTAAWQLARFQLTRRIAQSLGDSWSSCKHYNGWWTLYSWEVAVYRTAVIRRREKNKALNHLLPWRRVLKWPASNQLNPVMTKSISIAAATSVKPKWRRRRTSCFPVCPTRCCRRLWMSVVMATPVNNPGIVARCFYLLLALQTV